MGSAIFAQLMAESPYTLQWAAFSNTWLLGPTQVHNSNSISIGSALFAGLTAQSVSILYNDNNGRNVTQKGSLKYSRTYL